MILRKEEDQKEYNLYLKNNKKYLKKHCIFCEKRELVNEFENFILVKNMFPYWKDGEKIIVDHHMLAPKRHVSRIKDLSLDELSEFCALSRILTFEVILMHPVGERTIKEHINWHCFNYLK